MSPRSASLAAALALALALPACSAELGSDTKGELGRANFSYSSCFFGCAVDRPVLAGAVTRISVEGEGLPELTAVSSDLRVVQVETERAYSCCRSTGDSTECAIASKYDTCEAGFSKTVSNTIVVRAQAPGSARIVMENASGKEFDAVRVEVATPAKSFVRVFGKEAREVDAIALTSGTRTHVEVVFQDGNGKTLEAGGGVSLRLDDPSVVAFQDPALLNAETLVSTFEQGGFMQTPVLVARKAGTTTLHAVVGGVERSFVVQVK